MARLNEDENSDIYLMKKGQRGQQMTEVNTGVVTGVNVRHFQFG